MAGYQPSSFCMIMNRDEALVHKSAKKRMRPISSHLDRTSLVSKGFLTWPKDYTKESRFCGNTEHRIRFILPAHRASYIIKDCIVGLFSIWTPGFKK